MGTQLSGPVLVASQGLMTETSTANQNIGELIFSNDGRAFRYAKAGAANLITDNLLQSPAEDTGLQNLTAVAASAGDLSISSTSTVTVTANEYAGGLAIITITPGVGYAYKVKGHAAFSAAAPTFQLDDAIKVALTTTSRIDLVRNPFFNVIQNPTTPTSAPVGSCVGTITAAFFGWIQVSGVAPVLADGALVVGLDVVASNGTAGAVETAVGNIGTQSRVGTAVTGVATTDVGAVKLALL